jgi:hypothetical protein
MMNKLGPSGSYLVAAIVALGIFSLLADYFGWLKGDD